MAASPAVPFDYELLEGDPDLLRTVDSSPAPPTAYIDPASLKLRHRIGRGLFGDVWVATLHQTSSEFDEYHEVVVKMLHPVKEDSLKDALRKLEALWLNLRQLRCVCWLHGVTVISGQICLAMKPYEGSVGDKMALRKGGKLPLADILRYGIELAAGIYQLHQRGFLLLNLKPNNFLLDENDHVVLGDFGIPFLLRGIPWFESCLEVRLGTPNYMAPEQWQPQIRGPISYETDSWGFACSIIEMVSGSPPWFGPSFKEIYQSVVMRQQKPMVPSGLPPAVEQVLRGCFEFELQNRPTMQDILAAFESSQADAFDDESVRSAPFQDKPNQNGYSTWFLSKDQLQIGDTVRSRKGFYRHGTEITGVVTGLEKDSARDGFVLVKVPTMKSPLKLNAQALERVTSGFSVGNWVKLMKQDNQHSYLGILHHIHRDGSVAVGFLGLETLWRGHFSDIQIAKPFFTGEFVRLKPDITTPQFEWPHKRGGSWASGRISQVFPNGCLSITFPGRFVLGEEHESTCFLANPDEVEHVSFGTCNGIMEKYQLFEDFHWAIRPLAIAVGVLAVTKMSFFAGKKVCARINKRVRDEKRTDGGGAGNQEGKSGSGSAAGWFPPKVANILFNESA